MPCSFSSVRWKSLSLAVEFVTHFPPNIDRSFSFSCCSAPVLSDHDVQCLCHYSLSLSRICTFYQTSLHRNFESRQRNERIAIVPPSETFEEKSRTHIDHSSTGRVKHRVSTNKPYCDQLAMGHHRSISRSCDQLNQIEQATKTYEEELLFDSQATSLLEHSAVECSDAYQCTEACDLEDQSNKKEHRQPHDTDRCVLAKLIDPAGESTDGTTDLSSAIVPSSTVVPLPSSTVQIDPSNPGEITIYSLINVIYS